jgi:hypothetical protein
MHKLLAAIAVFGIVASATAADLSKEGAFKGTYTAVGNYKSTKVGDRALNVFDEIGVQTTNGFGDHMTFHCWGTAEIANGESSNQGYCVGTDPSGDLIEAKFGLDKHPAGKAAKGSASYLAGTGKFAGITGTIALAVHAAEFRPITDGTYVANVDLDGHYKLP